MLLSRMEVGVCRERTWDVSTRVTRARRHTFLLEGYFAARGSRGLRCSLLAGKCAVDSTREL